MTYFRPKPGVLLAILLSMLVAPVSALEIQHLIEAKEAYAEHFATASGLAINDSGTIYLPSQENGSLLTIIDSRIKSVSLTPSVFKDSDLGAIGILPSGKLVVANQGSGKIAILGDQLEAIARFSRSGSGPGQLKDPRSIAVSVNKNIYVGDFGNNQITVFNDQGLFLHSFGRHGSSDDDISKPTHIGLDADENVYVLEAAGRLSIFDLKGNLIDRIVARDYKEQLGVIPEFSAMAVDMNGTLYLGDRVTSQIVIYDWRRHEVLKKFGTLGESRAQYRRINELAVNNRGQIAILDSKNKKIEVFQLDETEFAAPNVSDKLRVASSRSSICHSIHAVSTRRHLCIRADQKSIVILSADGKELEEFAQDIEEPKTLHSDGRSVAILEGNSLHVYSITGKKKFSVGRFGNAPGGFKDPSYVFVRKGNYYVSDTGNNRIQIFSNDGQFVEEIKSKRDDKELFSNVGPLVVDSHSRLYLADNMAGMIRVIDEDRNLIASVGHEADSIHKVTKYHALDIDAQDRLYMLASTDFNDYEVTIFKDLKVFRKFGGAGDNDSGLNFKEASSLSVASADINIIHINDSELKRHYSYDFLEYPDAAFGLKIAANNTQLDLFWSSSRSALITAYDIQAARSETGPFETIKSTPRLHVSLPVSTVGDNLWFRVVSVSGHGLQAKPSIARENKFQKMLGFYQAGEHRQVIKFADKLLKIAPDNADARDLLGMSLFASKDYTRTIAEYSLLEDHDQYRNKAINYQAQAYVELGQFLEARGLIDRVLETSPNEVEPYLICSRLSLELDDAIGAVTCAEDGLALQPNHVELGFLLGRSYIAAGLKDEGYLAYRKLVEKNPNDLPTRIKIADDLYRLGRFEAALQHYQFAGRQDPAQGSAQVGRARSLLQLDRDEEARAIAVKLSGKKETRGDGNYLLGKISAKQGEFKKAVLRFTRASKEKPELVDAWLSLAGAYQQLNQPDKAAKSLKLGIKRNGEAYELFQLAGKVLLQNENYPEANAHLDRAVSLQPSSLIARKLYARGLFATRNYRSAAIHANVAARIAPKDIEVLTLQADIANQRGKVGSAIEFLKTAITIDPASPNLQYQIGRVYQEANLFDASREHLEKAAGINPAWAAPHVALGKLYGKRRLFDEAIAAYEKAVELEPSEKNRAILNIAFGERKRALEFQNNAPQLVLSDLSLDTVFSATYKKYQDQPIGNVTLKNASATDYGNLKLSFQIKEFMDFPTSIDIAKIAGNETQTLNIKATFNNKILEVDEDTGVQVEVKLTYLRDGRKDDISLTQPMTIYGKNAIVWGDPAMIGSFVTPKDDTLRDYVRQVVNTYQPEPGPLNGNLVTAMAYFSGLTASGTKYIIDPNTPFTELRDDQVDYVQFPRETLRLKSGDCDDLSVLISAGLENLGIKTAFLEIPGHLFMMFDTGLPAVDAGLISQDDSLIAIKDGNVWIPLEATMVNTSFIEAWAEGGRKYHKALAANELGIIDLKQAWQQYKPVTLSKASFSVALPEEKRTSSLVKQAQTVLLSKSIDRLVLPYQAMVASNPRNIAARLQIAILYARFGLFEDAEIAFEALSELAPDNSAVYTNQGNLYFLQEEYDLAIKNYRHAVDLDGEDGGIWINLSMAQYKAGDLKQAGLSYQRATQLDPALAQEYEAYAKLLSQ